MRELVVSVCLATLVMLVDSYDGDDRRGSKGCPQAFGANCHCGYGYYPYFRDRQVYITNCTNTGFTDATVLEFTPKETEVLIFTGNHIPTLKWNLLGVWKDYENLTVIDLSNNGIKEIPGKTFHKVSSVRMLILDHNDLYIVSSLSHPRVFSNFENLRELHLTNAFTEQITSQWYLLNLQETFISSELDKLEKLHLEQNEIWKISNPDVFCSLSSLMDLHLADNQLSDVNLNLKCLKKLRHLDLAYNKITNFDNKTLSNIENIFTDPNSQRSINIKGNPFRCDCYMQPFYNWFLNTKVKISNMEEIRCFDGFPKANAGKRLANIQQLDCGYDLEQIEAARYDSSDALIHTLSVIIGLMVVCIIAAIVWINREKISPRLKNYSMQYSSIEKEEDKTPVVPVNV